MHQLANLHGLNHYWTSSYNYTQESHKIKKATSYIFKELTKQKIEGKQVYFIFTIETITLPKFPMDIVFINIKYPIMGIDALTQQVTDWNKIKNVTCKISLTNSTLRILSYSDTVKIIGPNVIQTRSTGIKAHYIRPTEERVHYSHWISFEHPDLVNA